ncbi:hypothetical protein V493_08074 [Pseudogymnoascus sp. VKM F-4281 (FW-2241)]|nr:hypothetical protein V493_08074 [Pseudogymnoascus sp. VKM F-4281 (FW-2241)]
MLGTIAAAAALTARDDASPAPGPIVSHQALSVIQDEPEALCQRLPHPLRLHLPRRHRGREPDHDCPDVRSRARELTSAATRGGLCGDGEFLPEVAVRG